MVDLGEDVGGVVRLDFLKDVGRLLGGHPGQDARGIAVVEPGEERGQALVAEDREQHGELARFEVFEQGERIILEHAVGAETGRLGVASGDRRPDLIEQRVIRRFRHDHRVLAGSGHDPAPFGRLANSRIRSVGDGNGAGPSEPVW
jgi:hypothetical protein